MISPQCRGPLIIQAEVCAVTNLLEVRAGCLECNFGWIGNLFPVIDPEHCLELMDSIREEAGLA